MSVETEITRLTTAKANIKTAIESKGVTVPSDTKLDGYGSLIASIPTGGGSSGNGLPIGCPRIDLVSLNIGEAYSVFDTRLADSIHIKHFNGFVRIDYVDIASDGSVTIGRTGYGATGVTVDCRNIDYCAFKISADESIYSGQNNLVMYKGDNCSGVSYPVALVSRSNFSKYQSYNGFESRCSYIRIYNADIPIYIYELATEMTTQCVFIDSYIMIDRNAIRNTSLKRIKIKGIAIGVFSELNLNSILNDIDLSEVDFSGVTSVAAYYQAFNNAALIKLTMPSSSDKGLRVSFKATGVNLTHDSLMSVLNSLYDHISHGTGQTPTLQLDATNLSKLSDSEKAVATDKGWTLA